MITFSKSQRALENQFLRASKNKDNSFFWDKLKVSDRYLLLLKFWYNSYHPTDKSKGDKFYLLKWNELDESVKRHIPEISIWIRFVSTQNTDEMFGGNK